MPALRVVYDCNVLLQALISPDGPAGRCLTFAFFIEAIEAVSSFCSDVREVFVGCRDRDDNHYVNLALATAATCIVTRDKDLLDLMSVDRAEGREFRQRFPQLRIVDTASFARELSAQ